MFSKFVYYIIFKDYLFFINIIWSNMGLRIVFIMYMICVISYYIINLVYAAYLGYNIIKPKFLNKFKILKNRIYIFIFKKIEIKIKNLHITFIKKITFIMLLPFINIEQYNGIIIYINNLEAFTILTGLIAAFCGMYRFSTHASECLWLAHFRPSSKHPELYKPPFIYYDFGTARAWHNRTAYNGFKIFTYIFVFSCVFVYLG